MTARKIYWYGFCYITQDLKIRKMRVAKETSTRIYLHKESQVGLQQSVKFYNKEGGYVTWFPTREEAVAEKLRVLKAHVRKDAEHAKQTKKCLAEFKEQENV